ncbi:Uncharacterized protein PBTT_00030 [Plasmodiophora brassicae]
MGGWFLTGVGAQARASPWWRAGGAVRTLSSRFRPPRYDYNTKDDWGAAKKRRRQLVVEDREPIPYGESPLATARRMIDLWDDDSFIHPGLDCLMWKPQAVQKPDPNLIDQFTSDFDKVKHHLDDWLDETPAARARASREMGIVHASDDFDDVDSDEDDGDDDDDFFGGAGGTQYSSMTVFSDGRQTVRTDTRVTPDGRRETRRSVTDSSGHTREVVDDQQDVRSGTVLGSSHPRGFVDASGETVAEDLPQLPPGRSSSAGGSVRSRRTGRRSK